MPAIGHSRAPRNGRKGSCAASLGTFRCQIAQRRLQFLLSGLQLAGQLRVQVASLVDVADEVGFRILGALRGGLRFFNRRARRRELGVARLERLLFLFQLRERLGVRRDAIAIEFGQRGDGARRLTEALQIRGRQQQAEVARLAQLVDLDQPLLQLGQFGARRFLEPIHARARLVELALQLGGIGVDPLQLFRLQLTLDLQLAQVAEQRALVEARRSASRCSACIRSLARRASASVRARSGSVCVKTATPKTTINAEHAETAEKRFLCEFSGFCVVRGLENRFAIYI